MNWQLFDYIAHACGECVDGWPIDRLIGRGGEGRGEEGRGGEKGMEGRGGLYSGCIPEYLLISL